MREVLDQELKNSLNATLNMIGTVERMYALGAEVLLSGNRQGLEQLRSIDREVDQMEAQIEADCLRVIALHQPVARDLRQLGLILKCLTDIERMGDYVVHVAEDSQDVVIPESLRPYLSRMMARLEEMSQSLRTALADRDVAQAEATVRMDDEIDDLYEQVQQDLITHLTSDPSQVTDALQLMRIGRAIERIGDHMENIAERVPYWVTGEHRF
ncbi:phosphate transport system regulatory protein PhoU [Deinococcus piscis]|uniref:Phosphate-specific transport system accessory protein PhoU n=1 Tax=Deinococcus piscis TaxID=394230 RepID=A0ABQ3K4C3_9DEIO|nr:phosphate signaling complex protein PhoU [Deinococcus piscis]GHG02581.1 phosphate transport system regulatory protein PhoU [Deinococcus piscis]